MQHLFAVVRRYGPPYARGLPLEEQQDWEAHRAFMNALEAEGLVRLGRNGRTCFSSSARRTRTRSNGVSPTIPGPGPACSRPSAFRAGACGSGRSVSGASRRFKLPSLAR